MNGSSSAPAPVDNSPEWLKARYGTSPETPEQWAAMNGFQPPQGVSGLGGANPIATPLGPSGPPRPAAEPQTPAPAPQSPAPAPVQANGGYADLINKAWDAQTALAQQGVKDIWSSSMADRGMLPADAAAQDAYGRAMGPAMQQMAAGRAGALADAYGREQSQNFAREQWQAQLAAQQRQEAFAQQQFDWQKQQAAQSYTQQQQQLDWQRQQQTLQNQQQQNQLDWQKQLQQRQTLDWQREDSQQPSAPSWPTGGAGGGATDDAAARARAAIAGGSGGQSFSDLFAGSSFAPQTSQGYSMGGGAGLAGGAANPGTGGFGEKTDWHLNKTRPFEGAATTTVGSSFSGGTTTGSGTTVGTGAPFSNMNNFANQALGTGSSQQPKPGYSPPGYQAGSTFRTGAK